jgi:hypothetical protein
VYTEPWTYADHQTRKRRHSEVNSRTDEPPHPTFPQNNSTYASYLAEQSHLARKVRVTPYLLVNQNSQRVRVSDIGDHIVDWAVERLKPAANYLARPWHCLIDVRHERLARECRGEKLCRHLGEEERVNSTKMRNVDKFIERVEKFIERYQRRRMPRNDVESESEEESEFGDGDMEMEDAPPLAPPRRNFNPTVEGVEEGDPDDDEVKFVRENAPSPPFRRRMLGAPIGNADFADLDDDGIEVLRELRQRYNANAEDLQDASSLISRLPRFEQQVDDVENEARPTAVQYGKSSPEVREDAGDAGNENSSSSSSDDGSDNEEGPARPVRNGIDGPHDERSKPSSSNTTNGDEHTATSLNVDLRPIEPRPAPVLLPAHLIPAQIPKTTPLRNRHREESSTASVQGRTYAEYDRFQEMASQYPSPPIPRRNTRTAGSRFSVTKSAAIRAPVTTPPVTGTLVITTPATSSSSFTPFATSYDRASILFAKRTKHESTRTSSIWGTIVEQAKVFAPKPEQPMGSPKSPATKSGGEKEAAERPLQDKPSHFSSSSTAKSAVASTPGSKTIVPEIKVTAPPTPLSNPAAEPVQPNTLSSNVFSRLDATVGSDPAMKKRIRRQHPREEEECSHQLFTARPEQQSVDGTGTEARSR